jgi:RimJ/RimL family protein N-acetyltransferase
LFKKAFPWSRKPSEHPERENVSLRGARVVLREKDMSDVSDDYEWRTDAELAKLDATRPLGMSYDEYYRYSKEDLTMASMRSKRLAIDTIEGKHIGNCMFYDIDLRDGEAEIGIMIGDKDYWSEGYGTEAMGVLLDHMFTEYPFKRIYLHTLTWNQRALNSFGKSGMRELRQVRRSGNDFIEMEILRHEWVALRRAESKDQDSTNVGSSEISSSPP